MSVVFLLKQAGIFLFFAKERDITEILAMV
jgi:hypothetical protein